MMQKRLSDSVIFPSVASAGVSKNGLLSRSMRTVYHFRAAPHRGGKMSDKKISIRLGFAADERLKAIATIRPPSTGSRRRARTTSTAGSSSASSRRVQ